jgi:AbrB family looped-hinge helix DNA binding protein
MVRAKLRDRGQITLPAEVRTALHIDEGDDVSFEVTEHGVLMRGLTMVPADQAWFWTKSWQAGERQASEDIEAGRIKTSRSAADFLDGLDE